MWASYAFRFRPGRQAEFPAMAEVATMAGTSTLEHPADVAGATTQRTWASDAEVIAAVQLDCEQREKRYRRDLGENVQAVYNALRKRQAMGGDGTTSTRQLARDLYPDVGDDIGKWRQRQYSVTRWLNVLVRQGLIEKSELRSANGRGKSLGLRIRLLSVPEVVSRAVDCRFSQLSYSRVRRPY
jgi:hypothetical protein